MKETLRDQQSIWQDAEARVADVIARKYPESADIEGRAEQVKAMLKGFSQSPSLKFTETIVADEEGAEHSYKTIGLPASETPGEELPVEDVIDYLGYGDSHEFEFGVPNPDTNPGYLPALARLLGKPLKVQLPDRRGPIGVELPGSEVTGLDLIR